MVREVRTELALHDPAWLAALWPGSAPRACESHDDLREWLIRVSLERTTAAADGGEVPADLARLFYFLGDAAARHAHLALAGELQQLALDEGPQGHESAG